METVLRNFGNSVGLVIPKPLREALKFEAGQTVQLDTSAQGLLIRPAARRYDLDELLAQCDPKAPMPTDTAEWQEAEAAGREVW